MELWNSREHMDCMYSGVICVCVCVSVGACGGVGGWVGGPSKELNLDISS